MRSIWKKPLSSLFIVFKKNKHHFAAAILIALWCLPYITTGSRIEWGDFSFFAQAYEAIRISILEYGQFPWWNPWVAGGIPLYANPQIGVFSLQTPLVLIFGAPIGLKISIIIYTVLGYVSMFVLSRRYFKFDTRIASLLGLLWIFSSFFVSHLPSHYTFVWYMLAPAYIHAALIIKTPKSGVILGTLFGIMALSAVHNSFFHIAVICGTIIAIRLAANHKEWRTFAKALAAAATTFLLIAGHRLLMVIENVRDFPREVADPAAGIIQTLLGIVLPYSIAHPLTFLNYPKMPWGWGETTATIGVFASIAALLAFLFFIHALRKDKFNSNLKKSGAILITACFVFLIVGLGEFSRFSPYNIMREFPLFENLRVSTRWFLWLILGLLLFIGTTYKYAPRKSFFRLATATLLIMGVVELFVLNIGYQTKILSHEVIRPSEEWNSYSFQQFSLFGESMILPNGKAIITDDGYLPHFYREYEATLHNFGVLQANDALADLNTRYSPRCSWVKGCNLVLSDNATVVTWTPNRIEIARTAPGDIILNMNNSNYFLINGRRFDNTLVSEPYKEFTLPIQDDIERIIIEIKPDINIKRTLNSPEKYQ